MKSIKLSGYLWSFYFILFVTISCSENNNDDDDIEKEKQRIISEVKSNLTGEIAYLSTTNYRVSKSSYHSNSFQLDMPSIGSPKWSPDGKMIAFLTSETGNIFVKIFNKDGVENKSLLLAPANQVSPRTLTWSPDGNTIAVLSSTFEITYLNITSSIKSKIQIDNDFSNTLTIAWCPKNNKIAIAQLLSISMIPPFVDNPPKELLVNTTADYLDWTSDGSKLVYSGSGYGSIYTVNVDGSENQKIVSKGVFATKKVMGYAPSWMANGEQIVYTGIKGTSGTSLVLGLFATDTNGSYIVDIDINGVEPDCY